MTSSDSEVSERALISLIYLHLKNKGHKKAANVLKKHAPQVSLNFAHISPCLHFVHVIIVAVWLGEETDALVAVGS